MDLQVIKKSVGKQLRWLILSVGLLSLAACQTTPERLNQNLPEQTLVVSGRGAVDIPRTISRVSLGVEVQGETSEAVQRTISQQSSAVVKLLQANKDVSKLETTGINLTPRYSYKDNQQRIDGYTATNLVRFEIAPDKIGTLLDRAIKAGATRIDSVALVPGDAAIEIAQKEAISRASKDARSQAESALAALTLKQKSIVGIQINGANVPMPTFDPRNLSAAMVQNAPMAASTPVVAGEQRIEATVTLQIRYQ